MYSLCHSYLHHGYLYLYLHHYTLQNVLYEYSVIPAIRNCQSRLCHARDILSGKNINHLYLDVPWYILLFLLFFSQDRH